MPGIVWAMPRSVPQPRTPQPRRAVLLGAAGLSLAACTGETESSSSRVPATESASATSASAANPTTTAAPSTSSARPPHLATTPGPDIVAGPADSGAVALTFHGQGALPLTRAILDACAASGAFITVFAVGTWLHDNPGIGREILAAGHELGNHTWSHQQMPGLSLAEARTEIARGKAALVDATGAPGWWFRPSGTHASTPTIRRAATDAGYARCVSYSVDPEDFLDPGAPAVRDRTLAGVRPGSIVSLHLGHPGTVEAIPSILAGLQAKGLRAVTLTRLLA